MLNCLQEIRFNFLKMEFPITIYLKTIENMKLYVNK